MALLVAPGAAAACDDLAPLIDQVARGSDSDAEEAADMLIERVVGPLAQAIGSIESRPPEQQRRIRRAVSRIFAATRMRLFRADLPPEDARRFDEFAARRPRIAESLFDEDEQVRRAALERIPLEPGSAAGLLIGSAIIDYGDVSDAALQIAETFHDEVMQRTLTRFVRDETARIRSGYYQGEERDYAIVFAESISQAIRILGRAGARQSVPAILEALAYFPSSPFATAFHLPGVIEAAGDLGDERLAPALIPLLDSREALRVRPSATGRAIKQTIGDASLLALLRIYGIKPEALGFEMTGEGQVHPGFSDDATRLAAHRAFRTWYEENARKPGAERAALVAQSQPTTTPALPER
jgi:hypothetical protein